MPPPKGNPDSVQRTIRFDDTAPTGLDNFLPGSPGEFDLPGSRPDMQLIRTAIADSEIEGEQILGRVRERINDRLRDAAIGVEGITSNVVGSIANANDEAEKLVTKLQTKQINGIRNGLTEAYSDFVRLGFPVPTDDQVAYGNATGDYLGSVTAFPPDGSGDIVALDQPDDRPARPNGGQLTTLCLNMTTGEQAEFDGSICPVGWKPVGGTSEGVEPPQPPSQPPPTNDTLPHYLPPPGEGDTSRWCPRPADYPALRQLEIDAVVASGYKIGPTIEYPADTVANTRPTNWNGATIVNGWVMPDYAGRCPVGLVPNGGTGTFFTACVAPVCIGTPQPPQPPTVPPPVEPIPIEPTQQCPVDPSPLCGEPAKFPTMPSTPYSGDYCHDIEDFLRLAVPNIPNLEHILKTRFSGLGDSTIAKAVAKAITGSDKPVIPALIDSFGKWLGEAAKAVAFSPTCDKAALTPIATLNGVLKFLNQWFAIVPQAASNTLQQAENLVCQTKMPDQPSADKAYLADVIDRELWRCWTELNGDVVAAAEKGLDTLRTRPTAEQVSKLFRRKMLTEDEFKSRMRQNGVINDADRTAIHDLTQDWPSLSDLTPMLVRDVFDNETIDWTEVDKQFESRYTEETKKYFDALGLTRDVVKLYWRAHFHLPSFTMASEMVHRFRHLPENDPLHFDEKRAKKLLIQDDWHPDYIDRMLAITYRPMRLIDIRTSYDMRIIDDTQLKEKLAILGYSDADVDITLEYWKRRRDINDAKRGGFPSVKQLVTQYANCEIDDHTFRYQLSFVVESDEQERKAVEAAQIARTTEDNRRTISGISWQYKRGLISEEEATGELSRQGIDPSCVPSLVRTWKSQAAKQPKQLAAASLCKMLEMGIISQGEFVTALIRSGWSAIDADRITKSCAIGLSQKEMRKAERDAVRLARERKAMEREEAKRRRLAECGEPPCPANRRKSSPNVAVGRSIPGQA